MANVHDLNNLFIVNKLCLFDFHLCKLVCPVCRFYRKLIAHRNTVVSDSPPPPVLSPSRKAPPPPTQANHSQINSAEHLDLAGTVQLRNKSNISGGGDRPKSEFVIKRPAPPPPARIDSLKTKSQDKKPSPATTSPPLGVNVEEEKIDRESRESSTSSDDTPIAGAVSPDTKRRVASFLSRAGVTLETVEEVKSPDKKIDLPTDFSTDIALELIDVVRDKYIYL